MTTATTPRKTTKSKTAPRSKNGTARLRLSVEEARKIIDAGLAIELLVKHEDDAPEVLPVSYWLAIEAAGFRLVKIEDEEGATVYNLPRAKSGAACSCSCDDQKYWGHVRNCKHVRLVTNVATRLGLLS